MAYELTIARLIVEHGPFSSEQHTDSFRRGAETAAKACDEQRRLIEFSSRMPEHNLFVRGYMAFADALGEVSDGV